MPQVVRGRRLAWNSFLNLSTGGVLLLLSIVFTPFMISSFGVELYGALSVTWMVLANLAWLDFGFSRATARHVAQELAVGDTEQAAAWTWAALFTQFAVGALGAVALWLSAPALVDALQVQPERRELVTLALRLFAVSVPLDLAGRSFGGVLEAGQRFDWINGLNFFNTLAGYAVYAVGIWRGGDFRLVVYGLFALRFVSLAGLYVAAVRVLPPLKRPPPRELLSRGYWVRARAMVTFGMWVTVAAAVWPLILYVSQWAIGVMLGVAALPYYSVPFNLLLRLAILPASLTATLFPAFATMNARTEWARLEGYFVRSHRYLFVALLPLLFVLFVWTPELLRLWIGADFATHAALPMRILVVGFGVGYMATLSGALLEGIGRPDLLAKLYLAQLPFNVVLVYFLIKYYGIEGAAIFYAIRCAFDLLMLWVLVYRVLPIERTWSVGRGLLKTVPLLAAAALLAAALSGASVRDLYALGGTLAALAVYALGVPLLLFDKFDRDFIRSLLRRGRSADAQ